MLSVPKASIYCIRVTTGTTGLPHAVPTISSTVPLFSQSQQICRAFPKVQLVITLQHPLCTYGFPLEFLTALLDKAAPSTRRNKCCPKGKLLLWIDSTVWAAKHTELLGAAQKGTTVSPLPLSGLQPPLFSTTKPSWV